jgi:hypothetical protein
MDGGQLFGTAVVLQGLHQLVHLPWSSTSTAGLEGGHCLCDNTLFLC